MTDPNTMQEYSDAVAEYEREARHAENLGEILVGAARELVAMGREHEAATQVKRTAYMTAMGLAAKLKALGEDIDEPNYSRFRAANVGSGVGCVELRLVDESFTGSIPVDTPPTSIEGQMVRRATFRGTAADVAIKNGGLVGLLEAVAKGIPPAGKE